MLKSDFEIKRLDAERFCLSIEKNLLDAEKHLLKFEKKILDAG